MTGAGPAAGHDRQAAHAALNRRLQAYVGTGGDRYVPARDRITLEAVRRMTDVAGDRNPVYSDPELAARSAHGAVVAPPGSLLAWWARGFDPVGSSDRIDGQGIRRFRLDPAPARLDGVKDRGSTLEGIHRVLAEEGYASLLVAGGEIELGRYPRVGDRLLFSDTRVELILGPMRTALGEGYFVTYSMKVKDQDDLPVAAMRVTFFNFSPAPPAAGPGVQPGGAGEAFGKGAASGSRPSAGSGGPLTAGSVSVGQELPSMVVEVTPSLIVAGALFTNDTLDVHHDPDLARGRGFKDIFMNNATTLGLVTRFIGDWAGPEGVVEHLAWNLGGLQHPNDELRLTGKVKAVEPAVPRGRVTVVVVGTNSLGVHITCTLRLSLPAR
jgi:acyl dehydratase